MSASSSAEKNLSSIPESNLPKRNIIGLDRFNLSDEELHNIRIHAAVYKYNNFRSNTSIRRMGDRRNQLLPFKRKLLKSSTKNKACEDNLDEARNFKRSCNRYQGVGNFPTVHLNKTPVVCRPIKRHATNELEIHYPELPMNRFASHLTEPNADLKASSTRSVLDVLQDLSRKRIHSKDDTDNGKIKSKGLGGDLPLDIEAPYKPLFVQKPKSSIVLTKDSTTQTLDSIPVSEPASSLTNANNSAPSAADPKAELRRKLARQNNEIFASLSSSIFSPLSIKRKLDKSLPTAENGQHKDDPLKKRPRLATKDFNIRLAFEKPVKMSEKPDKTVEKLKILETSPKVSPSKDRMMNIYFDMQNGNPKAQIFQRVNGVDENEKESLLDNESPSLLSPNSAKKCVSFNEEVTVLTFDKNSQDENSGGLTKVKRDNSRRKRNSKGDDQSLEPASSNFAADSSVSAKDSEKDEGEKVALPTFNFGKPDAVDSTSSEIKKSETSISNSSNSKNPIPSSTSFNSPSTTTVVSSPSAQNPIFSTNIATDQKVSALNNPNSNQPGFKPLNFGSSPGKEVEGNNSFKATDFSTFKFGNSNNQPATTASSTAGNLNATSTTVAAGSNKETLSVSTPGSIQSVSNALTSNASFFGLNQQPSTATSSSPPTFSSSAFGQMSTSSNSKPQVTGLSGTKPQFAFGPSISSVTSSSTISDPKPPVFSFGQNQESTPQNSAASSESKTTQSLVTSFSQNAPIYSFGSKPETENVASGNENSNQKNAFGTGSASFGQTPVTAQNETSVQNSITSAPAFVQSGQVNQNSSFLSSNSQNLAFGQSTPTSTFSFGQKTLSQEVSSNVKTDLFGAKSQPNFTFAFGQKQPNQETNSGSQTAPKEISAFSSNTQTNLFAFGQKPAGTSTPLLQNNSTPANAFALNSQIQTPAFGQNKNSIPASLTPALSQPSPFGQPAPSQTSSSPANQTSTPVIPSFGQPSTTQSSIAFGQIATDQTNSAFGQKKTLALGQSSAQPGFGQNGASLFGTKPSGFGSPVVPASTSAPAPFGSSTQSTPFSQQPFGQKPGNAFGQSAGGFFNETPTTQAPLFGQQNSTSTAFGTGSVFGQSTSQQATPFGQSSHAASTPFGQTTLPTPFGQSNQFSLGSSTPSSTPSFATAPPNTSLSVFGFNATAPSANAQTSTFSVGNTSTPSSTAGSAQSPFSFGNQTSEPFKFGGNQNKETPAFGSSSGSSSSSASSNPSPFAFGSQSNNNNSVGVADPSAKPAPPLFNFGAGSSATSSSPGFNFGANPSPPVFSFGGSSGSSNSTFSFGGTPQPGGPMFGQAATPSPSGAFSVPGTFSIGSGSSQSRPRAAARHRRRP